MEHIAVEILEVDLAEAVLDFQKNGIEPEVVKSSGFDAASVVTLVIELSPIAAGLIAALYGVKKKSEKHIVVKHKGMEVRGVSEKTLLKLIEDSRAKDG